MKKRLLLGAFLLATASFGAQAQTTGMGSSTNGSPQNGETSSITATSPTTGIRMNSPSRSNTNATPNNQLGNSMSTGSTSGKGNGRNRNLRRNRMSRDSSSGAMQRP